jgi:hypothetical protein
LQLLEDGLGLQSRLVLQQRLNLVGHGGKGIDACPPGVRSGHVAGQLLQPSVFACRFVIHTRPRRGDGQRAAGRKAAQ